MAADARLKPMRAIPLRAWALAFLSAVFQVLPFPIAGPVPLWRRLFCWFCLVPLVLAFQVKSKNGLRFSSKQTALLGYFCGWLWYMGNCYWIFPTMHVYGDLASPVAFGILILFALYLGLYHALFGWIAGWLLGRFKVSTVLWLLAPCWVAVELARGRITGFPWDLLGYAQVENHWLSGLAPWTGVMGLSLVIALVNILLVFAIIQRRPVLSYCFAGIAALTLLASMVGSRWPGKPEAYSSFATLLQENLSVGAEQRGPKETRELLLRQFSDLSQHPTYFAAHTSADGLFPVTQADRNTAPADLVLWPEAPAELIDNDPQFRSALSQLASSMHAPVISDSVATLPPKDGDTSPRYFNSASFFHADGSYAGRYDKMHLVPFGEYTPYKQILFFAGHLLDNVGGFSPGADRTLFKTGGHSYGTFICYESIFGDEIREFAKNGADLLVNLSDDGWYGDSSAPWEHLDMVRMRAIENHRWVLRSTNTGVTGSIDPQGRLVSEMPRHIRGAVMVPFGYRSDVTFYTRHGDWIAWVCAVITSAALAWSFRRPGAVN